MTTERDAQQRRAGFRALAVDPTYNPRALWRCPTCDAANPDSLTRCDECGSMGPEYVPDQQERPRTPVIVRIGSRGQALVEMALVMPILLFALLGTGDVAMLFSFRDHQARSTATVVNYAASRPGDDSWQSVANLELPGCDVAVQEAHPGVMEATATCQWTPLLLRAFWGDSVPVTTQESAAADEPSPEPSPSP